MKNIYKEKNLVWDVRVVANGLLHYIGTYEKLEDANNAANEAANRLNGEPFIRYIKKSI